MIIADAAITAISDVVFGKQEGVLDFV